MPKPTYIPETTEEFHNILVNVVQVTLQSYVADLKQDPSLAKRPIKWTPGVSIYMEEGLRADYLNLPYHRHKVEIACNQLGLHLHYQWTRLPRAFIERNLQMPLGMYFKDAARVLRLQPVVHTLSPGTIH